MAQMQMAGKEAVRVIRDSLRPRGEHHSNCDTAIGEACDCYARKDYDMHEALDVLEKAIECHDELLAACKAALKEMDSEWGECGCVGASPDCPHPGPCPNCVLRAAIAKAEGGAA